METSVATSAQKRLAKSANQDPAQVLSPDADIDVIMLNLKYVIEKQPTPCTGFSGYAVGYEHLWGTGKNKSDCKNAIKHAIKREKSLEYVNGHK